MIQKRSRRIPGVQHGRVPFPKVEGQEGEGRFLKSLGRYNPLLARSSVVAWGPSRTDAYNIAIQHV